jgi:hypothetical protein
MGIHVNVKNFRGFVAAGLALLLGLAVATSAHAQTLATPAAPAVAPLLERAHEAKGVSCEDCHLKAKKSEAIPLERCVACHGNGDPKALAAKTVDVKPTNPHENRHYGVETDCVLCHRIHEPSVNYCGDCHLRFQFKVK